MGSIEIKVDRLGVGWIVVYAVLSSEFQSAVEIDRIPKLIHRSLNDWLARRPHVRVRSTLGLVEDGYTTIVHVWYDSMLR